MNWGHKIVIAFVLFGVFIITLVVICVREDFQLVSADYYQQELNFQEQIVQTQNVQDLEVKPELDYSEATRELKLIFPTALSQAIVEGEIKFFRPSNANQDFTTVLVLNREGKQTVDVNDHQRGLWMIKLSWTDDQKDYYMEEKIYL